jgi:hypothetical protein
MPEHRGDPMQTGWVQIPEPPYTADEATAIEALAQAASEADAAANADGAGKALYDFLAIVAPAPLLDEQDVDPT